MCLTIYMAPNFYKMTKKIQTKEFIMKFMKLTALLAVGLLSVILFSGCSKTSDEKVADATANAVETEQAAKSAEAQSAAEADWLKFKGEAETVIALNEKIIVEYKAKMTEANGKLKAKYNKNIEALETKNAELKVKLDNYQDYGKSTWDQFKSEFNHDMEELNKSLKAFTVENKK